MNEFLDEGFDAFLLDAGCLGRKDLFLAEEINSVEILCSLSDGEMKELGLNMGERKRLIGAIERRVA